MITVDVCGTKEIYSRSCASWIKEQYYNRKTLGENFWFIIKINTNGVDLCFASNNANCGTAPPRHYSYREEQIINMWKSMKVSQSNDINILLQFLNQLN